MRKRRGVDLPPPGVGGSGGHCCRCGDDETDNDTPEHEPSKIADQSDAGEK
jgi:hypothetical protein